MNKRITLWLLATLFLTTLSLAEAQQANISRIGILMGGSRSIVSGHLQAFKQRLQELGYVEGKNIIMDYRYGEGKLEPLAGFADELVRLKPDVIVTNTSMTTEAAKNATKTIPVVFTAANDPVGDGQVASLARPGGNLTGFSLLAPELNWKRLQLLKEGVSNLTRIAFLARSGTAIVEQRFKEAEADAKQLGLQLQFLRAKGAEDLENAFEAAKRAGAQALLAHPSSFLVTNRERIIELAAKHKLPAIYPSTPFDEAGGLMSYGADVVDNFRRAAVYVDKILKGAKPADLPTAMQIGLTIPASVLARADRVSDAMISQSKIQNRKSKIGRFHRTCWRERTG